VRRIDQSTVLGYRALFGAGFVALGGVTLWRILIAPAPPANKTLGVVLAVVMIGLGITRIAQYARGRGTTARR
jgi:hypothetical protein